MLLYIAASCTRFSSAKFFTFSASQKEGRSWRKAWVSPSFPWPAWTRPPPLPVNEGLKDPMSYVLVLICCPLSWFATPLKQSQRLESLPSLLVNRGYLKGSDHGIGSATRYRVAFAKWPRLSLGVHCPQLSTQLILPLMWNKALENQKLFNGTIWVLGTPTGMHFVCAMIIWALHHGMDPSAGCDLGKQVGDSPVAQPAAGYGMWMSVPCKSSLLLLSSAPDVVAEFRSPLVRGSSMHVETGDCKVQESLAWWEVFLLLSQTALLLQGTVDWQSFL